MPNQISKQKLIDALKARKQRIIEDHAKKVKAYEKSIDKFRQLTLKNLKKVSDEIRLAKTPGEILDIIEGARVFTRLPRRYFNKPPIAAINKTLIELELLGDDILTVESRRNYLAILHGDDDSYDKEYSDDSEYESEEDD